MLGNMAMVTLPKKPCSLARPGNSERCLAKCVFFPGKMIQHSVSPATVTAFVLRVSSLEIVVAGP